MSINQLLRAVFLSAVIATGVGFGSFHASRSGPEGYQKAYPSLSTTDANKASKDAATQNASLIFLAGIFAISSLAADKKPKEKLSASSTKDNSRHLTGRTIQ